MVEHDCLRFFYYGKPQAYFKVKAKGAIPTVACRRRYQQTQDIWGFKILLQGDGQASLRPGQKFPMLVCPLNC